MQMKDVLKEALHTIEQQRQTIEQLQAQVAIVDTFRMALDAGRSLSFQAMGINIIYSLNEAIGRLEAEEAGKREPTVRPDPQETGIAAQCDQAQERAS
jgi:hypothetical protein